VRVLVTGGAGFIGSHLVPELAGRGWSVVVLDDFSSGKMENLGGLVGSDGLRVVKGDVRDRKVVDEVLEGSMGLFIWPGSLTLPRLWTGLCSLMM